MNANRKAILDVIAFCEGTSSHPMTKHNGYDVIVTGLGEKGEVFTDFSDHPFANGRAAKVFSRNGSTSTASGRYQRLYRFWKSDKVNLSLPDFSPDSQDKVALQLIRECKALEDVDRGNVEGFSAKCCNIWASLPGSPYGQRTHELETVKAKFKEFGGTAG